MNLIIWKSYSGLVLNEIQLKLVCFPLFWEESHIQLFSVFTSASTLKNHPWDAPGNIWNPGDWTWASHLQGKHPTHWTISQPQKWFLINLNFSSQQRLLNLQKRKKKVGESFRKRNCETRQHLEKFYKVQVRNEVRKKMGRMQRNMHHHLSSLNSPMEIVSCS